MADSTDLHLSKLRLEDDDVSSLHSLPTPLTPATLLSDEELDDESADSLIARWQEALDACKDKVQPEEWDIVSKFRTPEELEADLQRRHKMAQDSVTTRLITQMYPCLRLIKEFSALFLRSLPDGRIEFSLFWGIFYLAIMTSLESIERLRKIVEILTQIEKNLRRFRRYSKLQHIPEMREALVAFFEGLIRLWIEVVRNSSGGAKWSVSINDQFYKVIEELKGAIEHVHQIAAFEQRGIDTQTKHKLEAQIIDMMTMDDDANVRWPTDKIPPSNENFQSRGTELKAISDFFDSAKSHIGLRTYVLYGIGGMGKTSVAQAYAHLCKIEGEYDGIFWLKSQTVPECKAAFAAIAVWLDLPYANKLGNHEHNVFLVKQWSGKTNKKCLYIYDNVDNYALLTDFLPQGSADLLITTRYRWVAKGVKGKTSVAELTPLSSSDSVSLFNTIRKHYSDEEAPESEQDLIESLLEGCGGHPLAIEQFAAYIGTNGFTMPMFLDKYKRMTLRIHKDMRHSKMDGFIPNHSLHTLWQMSFDQIMGTDASRLLAILSMLNPDEIQYEMLVLDSDDSVDSFADFCKDEGRVDDALKDLSNLALIKSFGSRISLHRMIQKAYLFTDKGLRPEELQRAFSAAVYMVNRKFPKIKGHGLFNHWNECAAYHPHVAPLVSLYEHSKPIQFYATPEFEILLVDCCWYQYEIGDLTDCLRLIDIARKMSTDKEGLLYSQLCNTAGAIYYEYNNLVKCRENHTKCIAIRTELLTGPNPDLANTYGNMGNLLLSEGRINEALEMFEKSGKIRRHYASEDSEAMIYLGLNHITTGRAYVLKKDFKSARSYYDGARAIFKKSGSENTWLVGSLFFLEGNLDMAENDLTAAETSFERAFDIQYQLGPRQIGTAACYFKRAWVSYLMKRFEEAWKFTEPGLVIARYRQSIGEEARLLYVQALILIDSPDLAKQKGMDGAAIMKSAESLKSRFVSEVANGVEPAGDTEVEKYNSLVCGYFR